MISPLLIDTIDIDHYKISITLLKISVLLCQKWQ